MKLTRNRHIATSAPGERLRLLGFATLMLICGVGLGAVGGPPRLPQGAVRLDQLAPLLSGSTLPMQPLALALVDLAWLMWIWIVGSLGLEMLVVAAEAAADGAAWARSLRRLSDRVTFPLARRAVAAAFAVQILSRGAPLAAAQEISPAEASIVAEAARPWLATAGTAAPNPLAQPAPASYVVRTGDTLWSIAEQAYGSGTAYRRLVEANVGRRMRDGQVFAPQGVIQPGWELVVPEPSLLVDHMEEADGQRWYLVQPGDTLSRIADTVLGDETRWRELFELNRGATSPDDTHSLTDPNVIWPGLRLRLPLAAVAPVEGPEPAVSEQVAAGEVSVSAPQPSVQASTPPVDEPANMRPAEEIHSQPLVRTLHVLEPVAFESSAAGEEPTGDSTGPDAGLSPSDAEVEVHMPPALRDIATLPVALGGLSLVTLAGGVALGTRRLRRLRQLPQEPESEVVVEGGFAEAELAHEFTRGVHGVGSDPVAAIVDQLRRFLDEYNLAHVGVVAVRHGRSATTLTLAAGLADQPILVDLAPGFASRLDAHAEAWVSSDQDVVVRLVRVRKTRLLPAVDGLPEGPCLVPLGVLYDRQAFLASCNSLGHVLIASLPGHGADTILTSLVATLTARRSPDQLGMWMIARPRALAAPLFDLPHLVREIDPEDERALPLAAEDLRAELDRRALHGPGPDLVIVIPELASLGDHAASFELLAGRAANLGVRFITATSSPDQAVLSPLLAHVSTRMVLRMQHEEASVALLGVADAAFLGGGGRLLLRLDGREPVELYGYQVSPEHLERLVQVMRMAYPAEASLPAEPPPPFEPADQQPIPAPALETDACSTPLAAPAAAEVPAELEPAATTAPPPIQVSCFGGPRVMCAGQQVWPRRGGEAKPWEFLLYLACQPAEGVSSGDAVEALWPDEDDFPDAAHRFRQLRYRLRHALTTVAGAPETDGICLERGTLTLDPGVVYSDAQEFLGLVRSARINPGPSAIPHLERARQLYVSDLLEGPDARRYAWLDERDESGVTLREHFRRLFQQASTRLAEMYAVSGELGPAVDLYRELTEIDPSDERLWHALFRLHADRGDRLALIREEHRLRAALRQLAGHEDDSGSSELAEPSRETVQEYQRLLAGLHEPGREAAAV